MRQCGACQVCCVVPEIKELGKPAGEPCKNLTPQGCGIYDERPDVCRRFECAWKLKPKYREDERPDLVGVMVMGLDLPTLKMNVAHELRPGALDAWKGDRLVKRESKHELLGMCFYGQDQSLDKVKLAGPTRLVGRIDAAVRSRR